MMHDIYEARTDDQKGNQNEVGKKKRQEGKCIKWEKRQKVEDQ